jgi:hypothetical protein
VWSQSLLRGADRDAAAATDDAAAATSAAPRTAFVLLRAAVNAVVNLSSRECGLELSEEVAGGFRSLDAVVAAVAKASVCDGYVDVVLGLLSALCRLTNEKPFVRTALYRQSLLEVSCQCVCAARGCRTVCVSPCLAARLCV